MMKLRDIGLNKEIVKEKFDYSKLDFWKDNPQKIINVWKENQDDVLITLFYVGALKELKRNDEAKKVLNRIDKLHNIPLVDGLLCYVKEQFGDALKYLQISDDVLSFFFQGMIYMFGLGVTQDYKEAVKCYQKAADQGNANAQSSLGFCYHNGQGVTQDYKEAVKWYQKAAEQGTVSAQYNLGICYRNGQGVTKDYKEAVKLYQKAADQGNTNAKDQIVLLRKLMNK